MGGVRGYLLGITSTALCCGILVTFLGKKGIHGNVIKFLCGIVMLVTVLSPLVDLHLENSMDAWKQIYQKSQDVITAGKITGENEYAHIIKERTRAYILDKAENFGADLNVEVTLSEEVPLSPCSVTLSGAVSPYAKMALSDMIERDLGIPLEEQKWTG